MPGEMQAKRSQTTSAESRSGEQLKLVLVGGATLLATFALATMYSAQLAAMLAR